MATRWVYCATKPRLVRDRRTAAWHRRTILPCAQERGSGGMHGGRKATQNGRKRSAFWRQRRSPEPQGTADGRDCEHTNSEKEVASAGDPAVAVWRQTPLSHHRVDANPIGVALARQLSSKRSRATGRPLLPQRADLHLNAVHRSPASHFAILLYQPGQK
jgi:hypothetical protein